MEKLKCNHCGNEYEFYTKQKYKGTYDFYVDSEGVPTDNSGMFDHADSKYRSKFIYCVNCDKKVGKIEGLEALRVWKHEKINGEI